MEGGYRDGKREGGVGGWEERWQGKGMGRSRAG